MNADAQSHSTDADKRPAFAQINDLMRRNAELAQQVNELTKQLHALELLQQADVVEAHRPKAVPFSPIAWGRSSPEAGADDPGSH